MTDGDRIADRVDMETVVFEKRLRTKRDLAVVSYAPSSGTIYINPKMVAMLNIEKWEAVMVGADSSGVVVLKESSLEEFGSTPLKRPVRTEGHDNERTIARAKKSWVAFIRHVFQARNITPVKKYRAQRDGMMVFLEPIVMKEKA